MTTSSSSKVNEPIFSLQICKTGVVYVEIDGISKNVSYPDAIDIIKEAIPEAKQHLDSQSEVIAPDSEFKVWSKYVVKSQKIGSKLYVLLYNPPIRNTYRQKFKTSGESSFEDYIIFWNRLKEVFGLEILLRIYSKLGLETSDDDPCQVEAPNYLYPSMACQVNFHRNIEGLWGFQECYYSSVTEGTSREFLQMKHTWVSSPSNLGFNSDTSWRRLPPLPNFFDGHTMCFGSIERPSLLNLDKIGLAPVDFYLDAVYSSYFNTDLYSNAVPEGIPFDSKEAAVEFIERVIRCYEEVTNSKITEENLQRVQEASSRLHDNRSYVQHILLTMILKSE